MPDTPSIVIAKSMAYRGAPETWTNKYHFEGDTPSNKAGWLTLLRAIWDLERTFLTSQVKLVGGTGYAAGNNAAAAMFAANEIGGTVSTNQGALGTNASVPGDAAVWARWTTPDRNSKNKPIYLRKYFHGVAQDSDNDTPLASARTAMGVFAGKMYDGSLPGGAKVCGPQGADATGHAVAQFYTTRTLKRNARTPT